MAWYTRLLNLARSDQLTRDIDREMAFHIAERTDELIASGMSERDARREATRRFGNPSALKERTRDVNILGWLESIIGDLRYAVRALRSSPAHTAVVVLSLGLGIGANTAIFSLIDAVMLKSLPVVRPQEIVQVTLGDRGPILTNPLWEAIRDRQQVFDGVFAYANESLDLTKGGEARWASGALVSGNFFSTLGIAPALGRLFTPADDQRGCAPAAVLGDGYWRSAYGGDRGVIGKTISLDGHPFPIIGVTPAGFFGVDVGSSVQVYVPICAEAILRGTHSALDRRSNWFLNVFGRLAPGLTTEQVRSRLAALAPGVMQATAPPDWEAEDLRGYLRTTIDVQPGAQGRSPLRMQYQTALLALMAAVAVVLLIACANVANLLLARASTRQREIAVRLAIGAGRGRIVRQLLTESVLLSLIGAAVGFVFARWGGGVLVSLLADAERGVVSLDLALDTRVLAFTIAVATITGICCGLAPAVRATRVSPQSAMQAGARNVVHGRSRFSLGKMLVVAQIALSLVLVMSAGLLLGTLRRLVTLDPGFTREGVLMVTAELRNSGWSKDRMQLGANSLLERLRTIPGVSAASASMIAPISGHGWNGLSEVDGFVPTSKRDALVYFNAVSDAFFKTMQTRIIAGRDFDRSDAPGAPRVAIVNQTVAQKFFGGENPVGKRMRVQSDTSPAEVHIVGLVEDAKYATLREKPRPTVYLPTRQAEPISTAITYELRVAGSPAAFRPLVTASIGQENAQIALRFTTLDDLVNVSLARERLLGTLSGFFGALALLLAILGLYGTISYSVVRRRNEIGVRMTLGAARATVVRMVLADVARVTAIGIVLGAVGALAATRLLASFLFGVTPRDPATLAISALLLLVVGIAAGALPAWRAARLDPMVALREQ